MGVVGDAVSVTLEAKTVQLIQKTAPIPGSVLCIPAGVPAVTVLPVPKTIVALLG